jgi:hypothetical protein
MLDSIQYTQGYWVERKVAIPTRVELQVRLMLAQGIVEAYPVRIDCI